MRTAQTSSRRIVCRRASVTNVTERLAHTSRGLYVTVVQNHPCYAMRLQSALPTGPGAGLNGRRWRHIGVSLRQTLFERHRRIQYSLAPAKRASSIAFAAVSSG
jgi:hypothetical protein